MNPQDLTSQILLEYIESNPSLQNIHWKEYTIKSCDMNDQYQDLFGLRTNHRKFQVEIEQTNFSNFLCISIFGNWVSLASLEVTIERLGNIISSIDKLSTLQILTGSIIGYENIIKFEKLPIAIQNINEFKDFHKNNRITS